MVNYKNVSVRLTEEEYKKLEFIHNKFNRFSYSTVSLADALRIAIKQTYIEEMKEPNVPSRLENITNEVLEPAIEEPVLNATYTDVVKGQLSIDELEDEKQKEQFLNELENAQKSPVVEGTIEEQLKAYEVELKAATNSKDKPYSDSYIKQQIEKRRKELTK